MGSPLSLALIVLLLGGCFDPEYPDTATCNEKARDCPADYICVPQPEANVCMKTNNAPPPTIAVKVSPASVRFKTGTPDLLEVVVTLGGFGIDKDGVGQPNQARFGHYHIFLDDLSNFDVAAGNYVSGKELVMKLPVSATAAPFKSAKVGPHQLFVSLANNNHTELVPSVRAQAPFSIVP